MAKFIDNQGREWAVVVDIPTARKVRKLLDINILDIEKGLSALTSDTLLLCDVLYVICQDQCDKAKMTDEDFGRALIGDVLGNAAEAYMEALIDFFPPRQRKILQKMREHSRILEQTLTDMTENQIPELVRKIAAIPGKSSPA